MSLSCAILEIQWLKIATHINPISLNNFVLNPLALNLLIFLDNTYLAKPRVYEDYAILVCAIVLQYQCYANEPLEMNYKLQTLHQQNINRWDTVKAEVTFNRMIILTPAAKPNSTPIKNIIAAATLAPTEPPNMPRLFRIPLCSRKYSIQCISVTLRTNNLKNFEIMLTVNCGRN